MLERKKNTYLRNLFRDDMGMCATQLCSRVGFMAGKHAAAQCVAGVCTKLDTADSPPVSGRQTN